MVSSDSLLHCIFERGFPAGISTKFLVWPLLAACQGCMAVTLGIRLWECCGVFHVEV